MTELLHVFDVALGVSALLVAAVALYSAHRVVTVMSFLVLGLLLAVMWARLGAPDIAVAEAALASGVTGAFLIAVVTEHPRGIGWSAGRKVARAGLVAMEVAVVVAGLVVLGRVVVEASRVVPVDPLQMLAQDAISDAVVTHPTTAVLLDFRAYDTFLEVAVLVGAVLAALSLLRDGGLREVTWPVEDRPIVDGFVRVVAPVVLLLAGWLLVAGSTRPGGAFQAGAVLTGVMLLLFLVGVGRFVMRGRWLFGSLLVGLSVFVVAGSLTFAFGRGWFDLGGEWGGYVVLLIEGSLVVSIGVGLAALVVAGAAEHPTDERPAPAIARAPISGSAGDSR
ncbi:DUF4040 domain-containing protein [Hoyosella rhizosphaerae]|uniref:Sodium:proton antiporter n=1 Tax=Hoyosella rhizosphaerae TaxID=1755582 RepID=A0A916U6J1_9ACTN|nr:hydrogenase subunit MbhD domain-containing protein [Hoyosella rhizosphaerae]MBN4926203.1 DUF4040 domain-containing protein [Hoyosella rhizosphaerae]GGC61281.1 sodium:proton antiporter [Hoyosella rhizosphaerae]